MTLSLHAVERPLELIYTAALEPTLWHDAMVSLSEVIGAGCFHLAGWSAETAVDRLDVIAAPHWQPALELYATRFAADDPRMQLAGRLGVGQWMVCAEHFSARDVSRSAIWQELLVPWGLRYTMCTTLAQRGAATVATAFMRDTRPFLPEQVAAARALLPHLQRAAALMLKAAETADAQATGAAALELTHLGIVALTARGRIVHANPYAEALLRGPSLRSYGGALHASDPSADARLQAAVTAVAGGSAPRHLQLPGAIDGPVWVTLMRPPSTVATALTSGRTRVLCILAQRDRQLPSAQQLMQGFGLSPAEARVVRSLAQGGSLEDCAAAHGVSRNTVKTQLASALDKLGVHDQRALLRLLGRLPSVPG